MPEPIEYVFKRIEKDVNKKQKPSVYDINYIFKDSKQCYRKQYPNYCNKIFGKGTTCKGSGKHEYSVISSIPGYMGLSIGMGTHALCKECLKEYKDILKSRGLVRHVYEYKR